MNVIKDTLATIYIGDNRKALDRIKEKSIQACVTSPPYYALRDYSGEHECKEFEIGREPIPDCLSWTRKGRLCGQCYVCALRDVFKKVHRVLRDDGVLFLNLGDSYCSKPNKSGLKPKDLMGIPWRVALALQMGGWYLRNDNIWAKENGMPSSAEDRCAPTHEYVFMFSKSQRYFFDMESIKEPASPESIARQLRGNSGNSKWNKEIFGQPEHTAHKERPNIRQTSEDEATPMMFSVPTSADVPTIEPDPSLTRNKSTVWIMATANFKGEHYAVFPNELASIAVLSGSSEKGCCAECGKPWIRSFDEGVSVRVRQGSDTGADDAPLESKGKHGATSIFSTGAKTVRKQIGWKQDCKCENQSVVPCRVLDPFAGTGTVGEVAVQSGRMAVLIELNPKSAQYCLQRTSQMGLRLG